MGRAAVIVLGALALAVTLISTPVALDAPVAGTPNGSQTEPRVAASTDQFLAVWTDTREGVNRIWGSRLSADASVLDSDGFPISPGLGHAAAVASDGQGWLVVWQQPATAFDDDLWGTFVDATGGRSAPFLLCADAGSQSAASVLFDGTQFQVGWLNTSPSELVLGQVQTDGGVTPGCGTVIYQGAPLNPHMGQLGQTTYFEWRSPLPDGGERISGVGPGAPPFTLAEGPNVECTGLYAGPSLLWTFSDNPGAATLSGRRMNSSGAWLDQAAFVIASNNWIDDVSGGGSDGGWTLFFTDGPLQQGMWSVNLAMLGVTPPKTLVASGAAGAEYVNGGDVAVGATAAVVWPAIPSVVDNTQHVRVVSATAWGVPNESTGGRLLSSAANAQRSPAVAASSSGWLVVWEDSRTPDQSVWRQHIGPDGLPQGAAQQLSQGLSFNPAVASDGVGYLVVYSDYYNVWAVPVTSSGAGPPMRLAPEGAFALSASYDGQQYEVTWLHPAPPVTMKGARPGVDDGGVVLASIDSTFSFTTVQMAAVGGVTLAAGLNDPSHGPGIYGVMFGFDAGVPDGGRLLVDLASGLQPVTFSLTPLADRWLLTWTRTRADPTQSDGAPGASYVFPDGGVQRLALDDVPDSGVSATRGLGNPARLVYAAGPPSVIPSDHLSLFELGVPDSGQALSAAGTSERPEAAAPSLDGGAWLLVESAYDPALATQRLLVRLLQTCNGACAADAGSGPDAGPGPDGGAATDAGAAADAGATSDAGTPPDAGADGGAQSRYATGCGCHGEPGLALLLAALACCRRRVTGLSRRSPRGRPRAISR